MTMGEAGVALTHDIHWWLDQYGKLFLTTTTTITIYLKKKITE